MKVEIYLSAKNGNYNAIGTFEEGCVVVKKGSQLRMSFAEHIRGGKTAKKYREDSAVVDQSGITLKDCCFKSPSTAAQFVMGSSVNGWEAWHVDKKTNLKKYIESSKGN